MNLKELAWAAGFFDGEGCFSTASADGYIWVTCRVPQVYRPSLERFKQAVMGLGTIYGPYDRGHKPISNWQATNWRTTQAVAAMLWRFLGDEKRRQYSVAFEKAKASWQRKTKRTDCRRGHNLQRDGAYLRKDGTRQCRLCANMRLREFRARRRSQKGASQQEAQEL